MDRQKQTDYAVKLRDRYTIMMQTLYNSYTIQQVYYTTDIL